MNSIKLTYINYVQMIKFMSSDFFVWCFIVVCFEEIWTRPYRDVFDKPSITRNGQSRPCGRHTLIEIDLIRLEAVFVAMLCSRWIASLIFFKDVVKVGFKMLSWWLERNMLVCFFRLLTEIGSGFAFITKFSKIFVRTSPGAFDILTVDVLNLLTSPGAFESLCQAFLHDLINPF